MILPTVKVKRNNDRGFRIINESDFDPDKHKLFDGDASEPLTRDSLAKMKKADVIEVLEAHNAEFDASDKVGELRDLANSIVFVDTEGEA